jgi:hypothetical protein
MGRLAIRRAVACSAVVYLTVTVLASATTLIYGSESVVPATHGQTPNDETASAPHADGNTSDVALNSAGWTG